MKKIRRVEKGGAAGAASRSGAGEKILNVLIVLAIILLVIVCSVTVTEFRDMNYREFGPGNQLYLLEDKNYGGFVSNYHSAYADLFDGRDESENALRETARFIEAAFLHHAADMTGDTIFQEQQAQFMDSAREKMGIYAGEADRVLQILERY